MKKRKKSILVPVVMVVLICTGLFLPGLIGAGDMDPNAAPAPTMHTLDKIYHKVENIVPAPVEKTGQTLCYDIGGTEITCTNTGQDGDIQAGAEWPVQRFTDNLNGTVTDNQTGLIWLKNANCPNGTRNWSGALTFANSLYDGCSDCGGTDNDCGLSDGSSAGDWRLPNIKELHSLIDRGEYDPALPSGHPFDGVRSGVTYYYWSSTNYFYNPALGAWSVRIYGGIVGADPKTDSHYVWPVRSGN